MLEQKQFRFPKHIIFMGRFMTADRIVKYNNGTACLYTDDELGIQTSFSENQFKFNEYYGNIERRNV